MLMQDYLAHLVMSQLSKMDPPELPDDISIDEVIEIARRNHMEYMIFSALICTDGIPEEKKEFLRSRIKNSVMRTLIQKTEANTISALFEKAGIKNQLLKGSILKDIYPSPEMREMSDIDILVDDRMMDDVKKILEDRGYTCVEQVRQHDVYTKKPFLIVEAHSDLYDKTVDSNQFQYFASFERTTLKEGTKFTYEFPVEDFYVYLMAHMAKHFYAMGCGIRNLVDVFVYLEKYGRSMNMEYVHEQLKKCGIDEFTMHIETLAEKWLTCSEHDVFYDELFQYMLDSGIYGKGENGIWNKFSEQDQNLSGLKKTLKCWYLFPPYDYLIKYFPWIEGRKWLVPIAWIVRGFKGIHSKGSMKKREMISVIDEEHVATYSLIYKTMALKFSNK